jgi:hypothetical protein
MLIRQRLLGDEKTVDRRVYLNSPLSVQVITPRLHDYDLCHAMKVIDAAIRKDRGGSAPHRAML